MSFINYHLSFFVSIIYLLSSIFCHSIFYELSFIVLVHYLLFIIYFLSFNIFMYRPFYIIFYRLSYTILHISFHYWYLNNYHLPFFIYHIFISLNSFTYHPLTIIIIYDLPLHNYLFIFWYSIIIIFICYLSLLHLKFHNFHPSSVTYHSFLQLFRILGLFKNSSPLIRL